MIIRELTFDKPGGNIDIVHLEADLRRAAADVDRPGHVRLKDFLQLIQKLGRNNQLLLSLKFIQSV